MSNIIEFSEKIGKDKGETFVSFESMMPPPKGKEKVVDPLEEVRRQQEEIRKESEAMIANANAEKERIEQEAYGKGFQRGEEEGRSVGQKALDEKIAQAVQLIAALEQERTSVHKEYEGDLLALVKVMVDRLVGHEVSVNPLVIESCLRKALEHVVEDSAVMVHLHFDDLQRLKEMSLEDPSLLEGKNRIELVEDPTVSPGGCLLKTDFGEIDARLENCREKLFEIVDRSFLAALSEESTP
ncbi:MAG: hypothetical protein KQH63_17540 [Desulfobulbaceae bacterium]|nr:hypothetical protein [Desulfobulbaceae bacterium]